MNTEIKKRGARNAAKTKLKAMRVSSGMSQDALAKATGINVRTLQHYEQGCKNFDNAHLHTILKVCLSLQCSVSDLIQDPDLLDLIDQYEKCRA